MLVIVLYFMSIKCLFVVRLIRIGKIRKMLRSREHNEKLYTLYGVQSVFRGMTHIS
jgi:hypothetical protein